MRMIRPFALVPLLLLSACSAMADFDGPTPLAWRWAPIGTHVNLAGMPLIDDNTIYISVGERIYALNLKSGNEKWKFPTVEDIQGGYFRRTPVMASGVLVVSNQNWMYGINPTTGKEVWSYKLLDPSRSFFGQPVSTGKFVVCVVNGEYLMAFNGADGKEIWKQPQHVFELLKGDMATDGDLLFYFTQNNTLCSLNVNAPEKVKTLGQFSTLSEDVTPTVRGDMLYINTGSYLSAFNATSGTLRWQVDTQEDLVYGPASTPEGEAAVSRDGILTIVDPNGRIKSMKTADGKKITEMKVDLESGAAAQPSGAGKFFVEPTLNGSLNLIDPTNGNIVWRYMVHPMSEEEAALIRKNSGAGNAAGSGGVDRPDPANYSVSAAGPALLAGDTLLMLAADGSLLAFDKDAGVDVTGPEIRMVFPSPGAEVTSEDLGVAFRITDDASGVKDNSITLTVNGKPVQHEYTADGLDIVRFSLSGSNPLLQDGRATFVVTATDWMGNTTTADFSLSIDNSLQPTGGQIPGSNGAGRGARGRGGRGG